jgi:hypothetical protein
VESLQERKRQGSCGRDGVGGGKEDSVAGGTLEVEIHDMVIACVAVFGHVCGTGGWGGYLP